MSDFFLNGAFKKIFMKHLILSQMKCLQYSISVGGAIPTVSGIARSWCPGSSIEGVLYRGVVYRILYRGYGIEVVV